jgi:hypothetical protein
MYNFRTQSEGALLDGIVTDSSHEGQFVTDYEVAADRFLHPFSF